MSGDVAALSHHPARSVACTVLYSGPAAATTTATLRLPKRTSCGSARGREGGRGYPHLERPQAEVLGKSHRDGHFIQNYAPFSCSAGQTKRGNPKGRSDVSLMSFTTLWLCYSKYCLDCHIKPYQTSEQRTKWLSACALPNISDHKMDGRRVGGENCQLKRLRRSLHSVLHRKSPKMRCTHETCMRGGGGKAALVVRRRA